MPLHSVGAAATSALMEFLTEREKSRQQDLMNAHVLTQDRLDREKETREAQTAQDEHAYKMAALDENKRTKQDQLDEKRRTDLVNRYNTGDIPTDPGDISDITRLGLGEVMDPNAQGPPAPGQVAPNKAIRFSGSAAQRQRAADTARTQAYIDALPVGSPERRAAEFQRDTGHPIPEAVIQPKPASVPLFRKTPDGHVVNLATGQEATELPQGGRIVNENEPPKAPNPQPVIMYDGTGKPHAYQFVDGQAKEINLPEGTVGKTSPISPTERNMVTFAQKVNVHLPTVYKLVDQADSLGLLGPGSGTLDNFLSGAIKTTGDPEKDYVLSNLKTQLTNLKSGFGNLHGRAGGGAAAIAKRLDDAFGSTYMTAAGLRGGIAGIQDWVSTYAQDPQVFREQQKTATPPPTTKLTPAELLKKYSPGGGR